MSDTLSPQAIPAQSPRWRRAFASLKDRRMAAMVLLSLGASLPFGAVVGVLTAWLTKEGIDTETIGILSLVTMGYAFKYLWAPAFQNGRRITPLPPIGRPWLWVILIPLGAFNIASLVYFGWPLRVISLAASIVVAAALLSSIGGRRQWLIILQVCISVLLVILALSNPAQNISTVALIALAVTLLSPTHDLILDAWRIEVARSDEDKDLMSALYQFGYKFGGFISGFVALLMAARYGWVAAYFMISAFMFLSIVGSLLAPDPEISAEQENERISFLPSIPSRVALPSVLAIMIGWLIALFMIGSFVTQALFFDTGASGKVFVQTKGPWIVGLTVILPAIASAILIWRYKAAPQSTLAHQPESPLSDKITRTLFRAILDPLMELIARMKWGAVLVLLLALTYRFTDSVWGSFAYAFYLGENYGALGYTLDDVAIASKFFGVLATIFGAALGAFMIASIGRMPVLFIGGIVAAATNLLYADLAAGAAALDAVLSFTHLDGPLAAFADWAATLQPEEIILPADQGQRMARLMITIFAENIAGGLALVAITAYLTSVVNPRFAAVQYALLASLTMLIGTLGKPWIGRMMETEGFYTVFIITFWLGGVAVVLSALEWWRQSREAKLASRTLT